MAASGREISEAVTEVRDFLVAKYDSRFTPPELAFILDAIRHSIFTSFLSKRDEEV